MEVAVDIVLVPRGRNGFSFDSFFFDASVSCDDPGWAIGKAEK